MRTGQVSGLVVGLLVAAAAAQHAPFLSMTDLTTGVAPRAVSVPVPWPRPWPAESCDGTLGLFASADHDPAGIAASDGANQAAEPAGPDFAAPRGWIGWPMRGNVPANTYRTRGLGSVWVRNTWTYAPTGYRVWRPAVAPDGTIYVTTVRFPTSGVEGRLAALNPDGTVKWSVALTNAAGTPVWASSTPVIDDAGNLYIAWAHDRDFRQLTCLSFDADGKVRWRFEPNIELETASHQEPVLANGVLYAALDTSFYIGNPTHRASIFALNPANGQPLWHWRSPNLDTFFDGPAVGPDGAIYHASGANSLREAHGWLYRILPDGKLDWSRDLGWAGTNAPPTLDASNNIYLGDLAGVAWKYTPLGVLAWTYDTLSGRIYTSPALRGGQVLIGAAYGGLHIVDAETGLPINVLEPTFYPMGKSTDRAGNVFFYCFDGPGTVFAYGLHDHRWWQDNTGSGVSVNACVVGRDGVLLVSDSERLKAFSGFTVGDLNCDGSVDFGDINPFVLALTNPAGYQAAYPDCNIDLADINGDGLVDFGDINPFVRLLTQP